MSTHPIDQKVRAAFALIVTSDIRTEKEDESGKIAVSLIENGGHKVVSHAIVPNDEAKIRAEVERVLYDNEVQIVITSGGTGISSRDKTVDAVAPFLAREMPGFGETFRRLSYDEVGGPAIMSRALAGVAYGKLIFCLPGSKNAMQLALNKLIIPNIGHMLWELNR